MQSNLRFSIITDWNEQLMHNSFSIHEAILGRFACGIDLSKHWWVGAGGYPFLVANYWWHALCILIQVADSYLWNCSRLFEKMLMNNDVYFSYIGSELTKKIIQWKPHFMGSFWLWSSKSNLLADKKACHFSKLRYIQSDIVTSLKWNSNHKTKQTETLKKFQAFV